MKVIRPYTEILEMPDGLEVLKRIERAGRTCYKSEGSITEESCRAFVTALLKRGHEAVIEHVSATVLFVCDRGVSHEIVRHRLGSYCQESTRYCNYSGDKFGKEITVIEPCFWKDIDSHTVTGDEAKQKTWRIAMEQSEARYFELINFGASPQEARSVLPNSLKTELVVTFNMREWRHFFRLRTATAAHPQMRELTGPLVHEFQSRIPILFDEFL